MVDNTSKFIQILVINLFIIKAIIMPSSNKQLMMAWFHQEQPWIVLKVSVKVSDEGQGECTACFLKNKHNDLLDSFQVISSIIYHVLHC